MGLYALADGRVVAVGNLRQVGVTLALFPKGYERDPAQGYDLHRDVAEGAELSGERGRVDVLRAWTSRATPSSSTRGARATRRAR